MNVIVMLLMFFALSADREAADALFSQGKYAKARELYVALLPQAEEADAKAELLDRIGTTLLNEGRFWDAESRFAESLEIEESASARMHRGQAYFYAGQNSALSGTSFGGEVMSLMNDAFRELARAIELEPGLAEAHEFLGHCERFRGNRTAEEAAYLRALECDPGRAGASLYLAFMLEARGEPKQALAILAKVPAADRLTGHFMAWGRLAGLTGDEEEERRAYFQAVVSSPEDPVTYQALWDATALKKRFNKFNRAMQEVLAERADAYLPHYFLGFSHQYAGRPEEAISEFRRTLELKPDEHRARVMIAEVLREKLRDEAGAREEYLLALKADPGNARAREVLSGMGFAAARDGDLDNAERIFKALRDADPTQWVHQANLALIMKERNRPEAALKIYEEAEERFAFEPQIPNDRGLLLMGLGRREEAFKAFETALERDSLQSL